MSQIDKRGKLAEEPFTYESTLIDRRPWTAVDGLRSVAGLEKQNKKMEAQWI